MSHVPDQTDQTTEPKRSATRDSLLLMTDLRRESGEQAGAGRVRNISATGMMVECPVVMGVGERVCFDLRNIGAVSGTVSWARDGRLGVTFDSSIDPQAVRRPIAVRATPTAPAFIPPRYPRLHK